MRTPIKLGVLGIIVAALLTAVVERRNTRQNMNNGRWHVILIGASIGQGWHLAEWPTRVNAPGFTAESIAVWQFDKSEAVEEVLLRPGRKFRPTRTYLRSLFQPPPTKPDIVILKECSSYFPGNPRVYQDSVRDWVRQLRAHNIQVILATVAPVTRTREERDPGKQESLLAYNRWVREYAREQGLPVLDLESAVRTQEGGSYLRDEFTSGDGTHLNATAYAVLDRTLQSTLCEIHPVSGCDPQALGALPASVHPENKP